MNKKIKIILISIASLLLVIVVGLWYASTVIDPSQLVKLLATSVKSSTGRDLKISGPVTLSVFPSITVSAEQVSLSNPSWVAESDMLKLQRIELDIKTLPLLSKQVEIDSINLTGLNLYLQKNSAGKVNWDMDTTPSQATTAATSAPDGAASNDGLIALKNISMQNANIHYEGADGVKSSYQVQRFSLLAHGDMTDVALNMKYNSADVSLTGNVGFLSKVYQDWGVSGLEFPVDLVLTVNGKSLQIKGELSKKAQSMAMINLALNSKAFDWPSLSASANQSIQTSNGVRSDSLVRQPTKSQSKYLFSSEPIPFDALPQAKGRVVINIAELGLPKRKPIESLQATLQLNGNEINIPNLTFQVGKGSADLQIKLSGFDKANPTLAAKGVTKDFTLEDLLARIDPSSKVNGGSMKLAFDVRTSGSSLHQIAGNSNGKIQWSINQAQMDSNFLNDGGDFVVTLLDAMNPLRKKTSQTTLECAVSYLPISNGVVNIANTVGAETDRLNVVLAGTINLKTEAVNLTIDPQEKSGLTTGLNLAGLVKMGGTLTSPQVGINQAGVVNSAVTIGLGILTGGASILAENAKSMTTKSNPCRDALRPWSDIYPGAE